jgi:hypothetical protein
MTSHEGSTTAAAHPAKPGKTPSTAPQGALGSNSSTPGLAKLNNDPATAEPAEKSGGAVGPAA